MLLNVGIGLIGCGTVGSRVAERLVWENDALARRSGVQFELHGIAVRSLQRKREIPVPARLLREDALSLACDPAVDVLIECAGGTEIGEALERALERGAHVITANKDLIATQGPRLRALAAACGGTLAYEAAACGAVPVVRSLSHALAGDEIRSIAGVVNGTTNAILCAMENGAEYAQALRDAQLRGYAEADPASDVEGTDAAHKLALLAQLAFGHAIVSTQIGRTGITSVGARDVARARALGYRIRLVAAARKTPGGIAAEVAPVLVPRDHAFAQLSGPQNALRVVARDAGALLFVGDGAGGAATASAVLGDLVTALRSIAERRVALRHSGMASPVAVERYFDRPYAVWNDGEQSAA